MTVLRVSFWCGLLSLASGCGLSVMAALPKADSPDAVKDIRRIDDEKQRWVLPAGMSEPKDAYLQRIQKGAEAGDPKCEATLGYLYQFGIVVKRDFDVAAKWYEKAMAHGHGASAIMLADRYETGSGGVPRDGARAFQLNRRAAELGEAEGEYRLGLAYATGDQVPQDWQQAREWYEKAMAHGSLTAATNLGNIHILGRGVPVDLDKAMQILRKPAENGVVVAQCSLGVALRNQGKDQEGLAWIRRSAEGGYPLAMHKWALAQWQGWGGIPVDWPAGLKWAQAGAHAGSLDSGVTACWILLEHRTMPDAELKEAIGWTRKAAAAGLPAGQNLLGFLLERGVGMGVDLKAAVANYRLSAEQHYAEGAYALGDCYEHGKGVARDYKEAARWYKLAAEKEMALAQYHYGILLRDGAGVETDLPAAVEWMRRAAKAEPNNRVIADDLATTERTMAKLPQLEAASEYQLAVSMSRDAEKGQPELWKDAVLHLQRAADGGHIGARSALVVFYRQGRGVTRDEARADSMMAELVKSHDPQVLFSLAESFRSGEHFEQKDVPTVLALYRRAAQQGHVTAQNALGYLLLNLLPTDFVESYKWLKLAADAGESHAKVNFAYVCRVMLKSDIAEGEKRAAAFHVEKETDAPGEGK